MRLPCLRKRNSSSSPKQSTKSTSAACWRPAHEQINRVLFESFAVGLEVFADALENGTIRANFYVEHGVPEAQADVAILAAKIIAGSMRQIAAGVRIHRAAADEET